MVRVVFRNLEQSEFLQDMINEKVQHVLAKFPDLKSATTTVIVGRETSPRHLGPGRESFHVKVITLSRGLRPVVLHRSGDSPYQAVAQTADRLFEVLHRALDRRRERSRSDRRKWKGSPHVEHEWQSAS